MRAVIFANGPLKDFSGVQSRLLPGDYLIAADGGIRHMIALGVSPAAVIGDLDSFPEDVAGQASGAEMIRHSPRKDETDLELAIRLAMERGAEKALVFGALGRRWDMTLANALIGAIPDFDNMDIRLIDGNQEIRVLKENRTHLFSGKKGEMISLIPICGHVRGITSTGLEYPLENSALEFGKTRGVSNSFSGEKASVHFRTGLLLCVSGIRP
ncbi:Thiamine diphosphokinase [Candidatus Desulfarcum epimagneticum]|uniref:Thiamine diphosphokinase n=1 Tax=uncultured Desulfobacteraceae bacterium TaxID=218296 RepID=A0A484HDL1_9BACT|nr:Thiamine diphosphokinase [uncultured Desulfobacteraceae bacterium]